MVRKASRRFAKSGLFWLDLSPKKPAQVLAAYNLCDGNTPVTTIARRAKIAHPSLSVAIAKWERLGIVLKKKRGGETLPLGLFRIE